MRQRCGAVLETTFLEREGLQTAPTGANICTHEGSLSNSLLTSDLLTDGGRQCLTAMLSQCCDIIITSHLSLQNDWHSVFRQQVISSICDALAECTATRTFYDRPKCQRNTRNSSYCCRLRLHKDALTSARPLSKHTFPVIKTPSKHSTMGSTFLQLYKSSRRFPRSFYMPLCKVCVFPLVIAGCMI